LNGSGKLFDVIPSQVFDRDARGARQPERVDQALHAPFIDPVIDGLARYSADGRRRTRSAGQSDRRCNEIGLAYPGSPGCPPPDLLHMSTFKRRPIQVQTEESQGNIGVSAIDDIFATMPLFLQDYSSGQVRGLRGILKEI
jgi:hypothetical protein